MTAYLSHPLIAPASVEERRYQVAMADGCLRQNTLIILPTGLGKTVIALKVCAEVLSTGKKVLMLAPTKPLVDQHNTTFSKWLPYTDIQTVNGNISPEKRKKIIAQAEMVISTPQCIANDLLNDEYSLRDFGLVIYDEAHRGVGNYAYITVADRFRTGISMGMTASPGSNYKKVLEICNNLSFSNIDMRSDYDPDVSPYVYETFVEKIYVNLPKELEDIIAKLNLIIDEYSTEMINLGLMDRGRPVSTSYLLQIGNSLQMKLGRGMKTGYVFRGLVDQAILIKIIHAVGLAQSQGMTSLRNYLQKIKEEASGKDAPKSTKELVGRKDFIEILEMVEESKIEHPKISRVMNLVSRKIANEPGSKMMIFTQYRDTCDLIVDKLSMIENVSVCKLIGQSRGGLKQKEQIEFLNRFKSGEFNVIVSTSVGEEGLDITSTDLVLFYEPVPSEIRTIQRRGRTGRKNDGEVFVLVTRGTIDEAFDNSSSKKEEMMRSKLPKLNAELAKTFKEKGLRGQTNIEDY